MTRAEEQPGTRGTGYGNTYIYTYMDNAIIRVSDEGSEEVGLLGKHERR